MRTLLAFLLLVTGAWAADLSNIHEYWVPYNTPKTFEWQAVPGAEKYELYLERLEDGRKFIVGTTTVLPKFTVNFKTHGHDILFVRFYKSGVWSQWYTSLDPAVGTVNGQPQAWVIYVLQP